MRLRRALRRDPSHLGELVAWQPGGWQLHPLGGAPVDLDLDRVLELCGARRPDRVPGSSDDDLPVWVKATASFLGRVGRGHLEIEGPDGSPVLLGEAHLGVLAGFDGSGAPRATAMLADEGPGRARAIRDLLAHGVLAPTGPDDSGGPGRRGGVRCPLCGRPRVDDPGRRCGPGVRGLAARHRPRAQPWPPDGRGAPPRGGRLNDTYDIRRPEDPESFLADLRGRSGPAVLLCSNYLWSLDHNLELVARGQGRQPRTGRHPRRPEHPQVRRRCRAVLRGPRRARRRDRAGRGRGHAVRGPRRAGAIARCRPPSRPRGAREVEGLSFRDADRSIVRTADRDRIADLDSLPSPYLTGEFDHLPSVGVATARSDLRDQPGLPLRLHLLRLGLLEPLPHPQVRPRPRVEAEMRWAGARGIDVWVIADANFGIMSRDVDIARVVADVRGSTAVPVASASPSPRTPPSTSPRSSTSSSRPASAPLRARPADPRRGHPRRHRPGEHHHRPLRRAGRRPSAAVGSPPTPTSCSACPARRSTRSRPTSSSCFDHELPARIWPTQLLPERPDERPGLPGRARDRGRGHPRRRRPGPSAATTGGG